MTSPTQSETWRALEREVHEQVRADLEADETTPLELGRHIAWSECQQARTNGFSAVHRVGLPQFGRAYTTCGELIPPPIRWFQLSPALIRVMPKCQYCVAELAKITNGRAA